MYYDDVYAFGKLATVTDHMLFLSSLNEAFRRYKNDEGDASSYIQNTVKGVEIADNARFAEIIFDIMGYPNSKKKDLVVVGANKMPSMESKETLFEKSEIEDSFESRQVVQALAKWGIDINRVPKMKLRRYCALVAEMQKRYRLKSDSPSMRSGHHAGHPPNPSPD